MIESIGAPTLFFTLSAADLSRPETYKLINPEIDNLGMSPNEKKKYCRKMLNENPLLFSYLFKHRADSFFETILKPHLKVKDFWYRTEFQHCGSPHIHGLLWLNDAPNFSELENEPSEEDKLICAKNPNKNVEYEIDPCSKQYS